MNEPEKLKQLESEIYKLNDDLLQAQARLNYLYQQLKSMQTPGSQQPVGRLKPITRSPVSFENFIGLKLIHLIGIVILVIGLSIGVKYAIDRELISEMARLGLAYAAGFILFILSERLRKRYTGFSAILFSGAMASLYFTTYAAFVYYALMSFAIAFAVMIALTVFTVYKALKYNKQEIALLGLVGAYGIPFLISKNAEQIFLFFLYISLINSAVIFLSVTKRWKAVGNAALLVTWLLFIGWAFTRYTFANKWIGAVYMLFFYATFMLNLLSDKLVHRQALVRQSVHMVMLNNLAVYISALALFAHTLQEAHVALVSFSYAVFLLLASVVVYLQWRGEGYLLKTLVSSSLLLFIVFIAAWWDGLWVTMLWLLTAVLVFGVGVMQKWPSARMVAMVLVGVTLLKLLVVDTQRFDAVQKIISFVVLGVLLLVLSFFYQKYKQQLFGDEE